MSGFMLKTGLSLMLDNLENVYAHILSNFIIVE